MEGVLRIECMVRGVFIDHSVASLNEYQEMETFQLAAMQCIMIVPMLNDIGHQFVFFFLLFFVLLLPGCQNSISEAAEYTERTATRWANEVPLRTVRHLRLDAHRGCGLADVTKQHLCGIAVSYQPCR